MSKGPSFADVMLGVFFGAPNAQTNRGPGIVRTPRATTPSTRKPCACDGKRK